MATVPKAILLCASSPYARKEQMGWQFSDIPPALTNVCFQGKNGHDANGAVMSANDEGYFWDYSPGPQ
jgi:hypothetical protein